MAWETAFFTSSRSTLHTTSKEHSLAMGTPHPDTPFRLALCLGLGKGRDRINRMKSRINRMGAVLYFSWILLILPPLFTRALQPLPQRGPTLPEAQKLEGGQHQGVVDLPLAHAGLPFRPGAGPDLQLLGGIQLQVSLGLAIQGQEAVTAVVLGGWVRGAGAQRNPAVRDEPGLLPELPPSGRFRNLARIAAPTRDLQGGGVDTVPELLHHQQVALPREGRHVHPVGPLEAVEGMLAAGMGAPSLGHDLPEEAGILPHTLGFLGPGRVRV